MQTVVTGYTVVEVVYGQLVTSLAHEEMVIHSVVR